MKKRKEHWEIKLVGEVIHIKMELSDWTSTTVMTKKKKPKRRAKLK